MKLPESLSNYWRFKTRCGRKQVPCSGHMGYMKFYVNFLIVSLCLIFLNITAVSAFTIYDDTDNLYPGFGSPGSSWQGNITDYVGDGFDTSHIDVSVDNNFMKFDIVTEFSGESIMAGINNELADLFMDFDLDGVYEYGIDLAYTDANNLTSLGIYLLTSWTTSEDIFQDKFTLNSDNNKVYAVYGRWWNNNGTPTNVNVDFAAHNNIHKGNVTTFDRTVDSSSSYTFSFEFNLSDIGMNDLSNGVPNIFFATAECGNDVVTNSPVPEPATMLLLGLGLLGLGAVSRKKIHN